MCCLYHIYAILVVYADGIHSIEIMRIKMGFYSMRVWDVWISHVALVAITGEHIRCGNSPHPLYTQAHAILSPLTVQTYHPLIANVHIAFTTISRQISNSATGWSRGRCESFDYVYLIAFLTCGTSLRVAFIFFTNRRKRKWKNCAMIGSTIIVLSNYK